MLFYIVLERTLPHGTRYGRQSFRKHKEFFSYECENDDQARQYAEDKAKTYGPLCKVKKVHLIRLDD